MNHTDGSNGRCIRLTSVRQDVSLRIYCSPKGDETLREIGRRGAVWRSTYARYSVLDLRSGAQRALVCFEDWAQSSHARRAAALGPQGPE